MMRIWLALCLALASPAFADPTLNGRTVTFRVLTWDDPLRPIFVGEGKTVKVGDGAEFGLYPEGAQNGVDVVPVLIDISASHILLSYEVSPPGEFLTAKFNGYELSFPTECALILGAAVDRDHTSLTLQPDALTAESGRLFINVQGLAYGPRDRISIDVDVGDCVIS